MLRVACLPGDGIGPEVTAVAIDVLRALPIEIEVEEHSFGGGAILGRGDAASRADARGVSGGRRRHPRRGRPARARGRSRAAGAGLDRPPQGARRLREPPSRHRPRHRPADRPRARRRPLLRRQRPASGRLGLRHVRVHAGGDRADRPARVRARRSEACARHLRGQGERARDLAALARDGGARRGRLSRRRARAHARRHGGNEARPEPAAVRRDPDREHVRRHPLRRRGRRVRRPRARGLGEPRRRPARHLRAGARLRSRHRREGNRQSRGDAPLGRAAAPPRRRRAGARDRARAARSTTRWLATPTVDQGGSATTAEFTASVLEQLETAASRR